MADETPTTTPSNPEIPAAPEADPAAATAAELYSTLEQERILRLQAQQEADAARSALYNFRPPAPDNAGVPQSAGLESVVSGFITDPSNAARGLQSHIQTEAQRAAREAAAQAAALAEQRMRMENENFRTRSMIENAKLRVPEFQDEARFAGAVAQASVEAQQKGLRLSQEQIIDRAARIVRQGKPPAPAPFVEGGGAGSPQGSPANVPQAAPQKTLLEKMYGAKAGSIPDMGEIDFADYTAKYVAAENAMRAKHGITPSGSVMQTVTEVE